MCKILKVFAVNLLPEARYRPVTENSLLFYSNSLPFYSGLLPLLSYPHYNLLLDRKISVHYAQLLYINLKTILRKQYLILSNGIESGKL